MTTRMESLSERLQALHDNPAAQAKISENASLDPARSNTVIKRVVSQLFSQQLHGKLSADIVAQWGEEWGLSPVELALCCLPVSACYAVAPVSQFYVGAVAIGQSGDFYFGANYEFAQDAIAQSVHAEQSAISHSWLSGEKGISDMVVNYTPCGHCRQFMNELNTAENLRIHLPHSQHNLLHSYLPDAFGPKNLNIDKALFDAQPQQFSRHSDPLVQAAISAAEQAYAPYSKAASGVALQVGDRIITGQYAENAAFNPSFLPLQSALNQRRMLGLIEQPIQRIVLAEQQAILSHRAITASLAKQLLGLELEYMALS